ncbi:MAG: GNAT family N-acetyltransferase [Bryobacteraceae bacterium]
MESQTVTERQVTIEVRALTRTEEFHQAVDLQRIIWKFDDVDLLPVRLFVVATRVGGQALGAYDGERMVGYCLAIPGLKSNGEGYLHSHMLGVLEDYRNLGVGRMLKLAQREDALERGIRLVEWTFDPLELKNAYFNLERLGAIVRRYVRNQYGTTTSPLHGGLPTDRCVAEWWLGSDRVRAVLAGRPDRPAVEVRVEVPNDIARIRAREPKQARIIQNAIGEQFEQHFDRGLAIVGFEKGPTAGAYLLGEPRL